MSGKIFHSEIGRRAAVVVHIDRLHILEQVERDLRDGRYDDSLEQIEQGEVDLNRAQVREIKSANLLLRDRGLPTSINGLEEKL